MGIIVKNHIFDGRHFVDCPAEDIGQAVLAWKGPMLMPGVNFFAQDTDGGFGTLSVTYNY